MMDEKNPLRTEQLTSEISVFRAVHVIDHHLILQEKIRYTSATGRKSLLENFAWLPTTISNVTDNGEITYSQYNYRILCHPLKTEVPLTR